MPISSKGGKAVKSKKVESKSKPKPKKAAKPKLAAKIQKKTPKAKAAPKVKKKVAAKAVKKATPTKKKEVKKEVKKVPVSKKKTPQVKKVSAAKATNSKVTKASKPLTKVKVVLKEKIVPVPKATQKKPVSYELGVVLRTGRRPEAIINKKTIEKTNMADEKLRYSEEELKEFEVLILEKLDKAKKELNSLKEILSKKNDEGTDNTGGTMKLLEDGADTLEKENFSQLAVRQQKFITQLDNAMARIKNGTYGVCVDTGKLIPKERLKAVPHTQHSIEAKLNRR